MPAFLDFVPAWAWRWIAIGGVAAAAGLWCFGKGQASTQAEWDASILAQQQSALALAMSQQKGINKANAAHAAGVEHDVHAEADIRAAVGRSCRGVLSHGVSVSLPLADGPPVPAVPRRRPEGSAGPQLDQDQIADDEAVICPALYRQATWLRDLAIAAGADKD